MHIITLFSYEKSSAYKSKAGISQDISSQDLSRSQELKVIKTLYKISFIFYIKNPYVTTVSAKKT